MCSTQETVVLGERQGVCLPPAFRAAAVTLAGGGTGEVGTAASCGRRGPGARLRWDAPESGSFGDFYVARLWRE